MRKMPASMYAAATSARAVPRVPVPSKPPKPPAKLPPVTVSVKSPSMQLAVLSCTAAILPPKKLPPVTVTERLPSIC